MSNFEPLEVVRAKYLVTHLLYEEIDTVFIPEDMYQLSDRIINTLLDKGIEIPENFGDL